VSRTNANQYPAWIINPNQQVLSVAADGTITAQSPPDFANDLGISEDGILWALSTASDPQGGLKILWSKGDGHWTEINTPAPGGVSITGAGPGTCFFLANDGIIWSMNIQGQGKAEHIATNVVDIDFGGSTLWALFPESPGDIATLHFGTFAQMPFQWHAYPGQVHPQSITGNSNGVCYGLVDFKPHFYVQDGRTGLFANGVKTGLQISYKEGSVQGKDLAYLMTANANKDGNEVMKWDPAATLWKDAGFRAWRVLATFYT
jgi:hypothetical protein